MRIRLVSLCTAAFGLAVVFAHADSKTAKAPAGKTLNETRFEALKKLAGEWVQLDANGKPLEEVAVSIKVTAGGSVVQETLFPGGEHEMVTMYHLDGPNLVLTHYCSAGNQPHMRAEAGGSPDKIEFKFAGASNIKAKDELRMDHATLVLLSANHYQAEWIACQDGKACNTAKFDVQRKK